MVTNCYDVLSRARAQPPPGVLKPPRTGLDVSFPPGALSSQLFPPPGVEPLSSLASSIGNMTLGATTSTGLTSTTDFGLNMCPNTLGTSAAPPGSPGKLFSGLSGTLDSGNLSDERYSY